MSTFVHTWRLRAARLACLATVAVAFSVPAAADPGVSSTAILLGQSAPLSGINQYLGKEAVAGANAYFEQINALGGVYGRRIVLRTLDDGYEPDRAVENTQQLLDKDQVFSLFGYVGTASAIAVQPLFSQAGAPFFAPLTGADNIRTPFNRLVFNLRAGYADETERMVDQLVNTNVRKIAVFYQNDAFGKAGLAGVEKALSKRGLTVAAAGSVDRNSVDVAAGMKKILAVSPDVVVVVSTYKASAAFIREMRKAGSPAGFYNISFVGSRVLADELGGDGNGVVVSQVLPFPWLATTPVVREYQAAMKRLGNENWSYNSLEGYLSAKVFVEGLKRAGKDLTREKLVAALETLDNYDAGGYVVQFSPKRHNASSFVELTMIGKDGQLRR